MPGLRHNSLILFVFVWTNWLLWSGCSSPYVDLCEGKCTGGKQCVNSECVCIDGLVDCVGKCLNTKNDRENCGECGKFCESGHICSSSKCVISCPATQKECSGLCVHIKSDHNNCGECGQKCNSGEECIDGKCTCASGLSDCKGLCVDTNRDRAHCGACEKACESGQLCVSGKCATSCPKAQKECNGLCIDTTNDNKNCGECGRRCIGGKDCINGKCACASSLSDCKGQCVDTNRDRTHCGACDKACDSGQLCVSGKCATSCPAAQKECSGVCVDIASDRAHCGACDNKCTGGKDCISGKCACASGLSDCKGLCVDTNRDRAHCGACDKACDSGQLCVSGKCATSCPAAQKECSGVCVDTASDRAHCGTCGNKCTGGKDCISSKCACASGLSDCKGHCVDINRDRAHCGACDKPCDSGQLCVSGKCATSCPAAQKECSGMCVDTASNRAHCGVCDNKCTGGKDCISSKCACASGLSDCSGQCVDTNRDRAHCGACAKACDSGQLCVSGKCTYTCPIGQIECNGQCVDVTRDQDNCGSCGIKCTGGKYCSQKNCVCLTGWKDCGGICFDVRNDRNNCGECGKKCAPGLYCSNSVCTSTCPVGEVVCDGICVNTSNNTDHCGACNQKCPTDHICVSSKCVCKTGLSDCNGICVDLQTDRNNCGKCGEVCLMDWICKLGKCELTPNTPDPMAASQIQEVRDNKIGSVKKVAVTYLKPAIGSDVAGFFIQARKEGPALFVAVDPATTTPPLKVGDIVSFNADQTQTTQGRVEAIKISSLQLDGQGYDVSKLVQEVSKAADLVSALDAYESELIAFAIKVTGDFGAAGAGFVAAIVETAAIQGVADLRLRLPDKQGTQASLPHKMGIIKGCNLTATAIPMWRFNNTAQPSAFVESELTIQSCPDAHVVNAKASDANTVIVTFSRPIDAKSIKVDGSQFNFDNNLVASAASVSADGYEIAVTTSKQGGDTTYKVTADLSIKDNLGNAIDKVANTASFNGFVLFARLVINELNANITNGCDLVELRVISEGTVEGFEFRERTSLVLKLPRIYVKKNEYIIIHYNANSTNCNPDVATHETQSPNEKPQSQVKTNYDTAYDLYSTYSGMVATDNVLTLYDANGKIMDAVMVTKDNTKIDAAAPTRTQAVNVGNAKEWTAPDGSIPDYNDPVNFNTNAVGGLDKTSTTAASGTTIQRTSNKDTNTKDDWTSANNGTWGKNNLGQSDL